MFIRTFFKLFPPPKFLDVRYAGIDLSDDAVRVIQFRDGHHGLEVAKFATRKLRPGLIEGGYIKDEEAVRKVLEELRIEHDLSAVHASIPEEKMYLFKTEVLTDDEKEVRQAVEFKLEENVPLSPADAIFYVDLAPPVSGKYQATVSVAPRKVVDAYLSVLTGAGLQPLSFEMQAKPLARVFSPYKGNTMIIHIMGRKTGLYVVSNDVISFTSTIAWGGEYLNDAIAKAFDISSEEADKLKKLSGFHDNKDTKKIFDSCSDLVKALELEIKKVLVFWNEHSAETSGGINKIILTGSDALLLGLISRLSPDAKVSVEIGNIWANAFSSDKYIPPISHDDSLDYAVATGLALPS